MTTAQDHLAMTLKIHGYHLTKPRRTILEVLLQSEPLTMAELVKRCPTIDRVSVYRTVAIFERLHIVQRLATGWKYKLELSGGFAPHHHHASCERCGAVIELAPDTRFEQSLKQLANSLGFDMHSHQLEIRGICQHCQPNQAKTFWHQA